MRKESLQFGKDWSRLLSDTSQGTSENAKAWQAAFTLAVRIPSRTSPPRTSSLLFFTFLYAGNVHPRASNRLVRSDMKGATGRYLKAA